MFNTIYKAKCMHSTVFFTSQHIWIIPYSLKGYMYQQFCILYKEKCLNSSIFFRQQHFLTVLYSLQGKIHKQFCIIYKASFLNCTVLSTRQHIFIALVYTLIYTFDIWLFFPFSLFPNELIIYTRIKMMYDRSAFRQQQTQQWRLSQKWA